MVAITAAIKPNDAELPALLERIAEIRPRLAANAVAGEEARRVEEDSIQALADAGAFKVSLSERYGGYNMSHRAALEVGREVARADGGTAWVVSLINSGAWYTRVFPEQAQDDIFGADPEARVSVIITPSGVARRVEGGYMVSGKWFYNSGAWHATWALGAVQVEDEHGEPVGEGQFLMPATEYTIEDVWYVSGMRSSGSNLLVAEDVFVPEHRMRIVPEVTQDSEQPYRAVAVPLALLGPQLGLGRAVFDLVMEKMPAKPIAYTSIERRGDWTAFRLDIARASLLLDTAELFARRAADDMDSIAATGKPLDRVTRSRVRADIGWAVDHVTEAIDLLLSAAGSGSFADVNPIQRFWRDQAIVARHGYVSPPLAYEIYGTALIGAEETVATIL
ncbi:MAG: acyl-CoA dehydrogenase family protein [Leucobacter sp.]|nr:acyl-CoA dehydrogenase family protein [Leucobacter sp.]